MNTRTRRNLLPACMLAILTLAGCGQDGGSGGGSPVQEAPGAPVALLDTAWRLVRITAIGGFVFTPEDGSEYTLRFRSENRLVANSDCNRVSATWVQDGNSLTFEEFFSTQAMCPPGTLHNHFVSNLRDTRNARIEAGHLILTTDFEGVAVELEPLASGGL